MLSKDRRFVRGEDTKSISYYCQDRTVIVDQELINALCLEGAAWGRRNIRICLHKDPKDAFHEMIILEREGHYFPPHRHMGGKVESLRIIDGELAVIIFNDAGHIKSSCVLGRNDVIATRVGIGEWHMPLPLSDPVIYWETKPGPFSGDGDRSFAPWAPNIADKEGARKYINELIAGLEEPIA